MISLSNIIKRSQLADHMLDDGYTRTFDDIMEKKEKKEEDGNQDFFSDKEKNIRDTEGELYADAVRKAQEILDQASEDVEKLRIEAKIKGRQQGYDIGFEEGYRKANEEYKTELDRQMAEFRFFMKNTIESVTEEKNRILEKYMDDLKDVTLTIAEKVIQTSLKSSGEIIKRMIVAAAGKLKKTQWVKIYVSQKDAGMMIQGDAGLLNELSHISGNIKIIAMDHAEDGTCIIELPEEIIDVSVNTQIENIKGILNNARL